MYSSRRPFFGAFVPMGMGAFVPMGMLWPYAVMRIENNQLHMARTSPLVSIVKQCSPVGQSVSQSVYEMDGCPVNIAIHISSIGVPSISKSPRWIE